MNSDISWFNSSTGGFDRSPSRDLDYGIEHVSSQDGSVMNGLGFVEYEPALSPMKRIKYLEEYGAVPLMGEMIEKVGGTYRDWPPPTMKGYINCIGMLRRFLLANRTERKILLGHKMGFQDAGRIIGDDALFIYKFSTEPTQIELYISPDECGSISEINRFNNSTFKEVKIPVDSGGLQYLFFQIFADLNRVDFNKLDILNMTNFYQNFSSRILNFGKNFPEVDSIPLQSLSQLNENNNDHQIETTDNPITDNDCLEEWQEDKQDLNPDQHGRMVLNKLSESLLPESGEKQDETVNKIKIVDMAELVESIAICALTNGIDIKQLHPDKAMQQIYVMFISPFHNNSDDYFNSIILSINSFNTENDMVDKHKYGTASMVDSYLFMANAYAARAAALGAMLYGGITEDIVQHFSIINFKFAQVVTYQNKDFQNFCALSAWELIKTFVPEINLEGFRKYCICASSNIESISFPYKTSDFIQYDELFDFWNNMENQMDVTPELLINFIDRMACPF